mmetsp:Transcript_174066/g.558087  ORF Transcript_174066/g.558087 Transcript_174066/m.558087 type:complete len:235 (+) Transcript_174066:172-876(+)
MGHLETSRTLRSSNSRHSSRTLLLPMTKGETQPTARRGRRTTGSSSSRSSSSSRRMLSSCSMLSSCRRRLSSPTHQGTRRRSRSSRPLVRRSTPSALRRPWPAACPRPATDRRCRAPTGRSTRTRRPATGRMGARRCLGRMGGQVSWAMAPACLASCRAGGAAGVSAEAEVGPCGGGAAVRRQRSAPAPKEPPGSAPRNPRRGWAAATSGKSPRRTALSSSSASWRRRFSGITV